MCFDISVEDLSVVDVFERQANLDKPVQSLCLLKQSPSLAIDSLVQVPWDETAQLVAMYGYGREE